VRSSKRCPKCSERRLLVNEAVAFQQKMFKGQDVYAAKLPLAIAKEVTSGLLGKSTRLRSVGSFESWTCVACGYTELYAHPDGVQDALTAGVGRVVVGEEDRGG
jgi:predicted nucleic-acid-binding Zn-ribbon protein